MSLGSPGEVEAPTFKFDNLSSYLSSTQFADFEVTCGEYTFKAHRIILCQNCAYFKKLNSQNWKEGQQAKASFEEEPAVIARQVVCFGPGFSLLNLIVRLLIFLYRGSYPKTNIAQCGIEQFNNIQNDLCQPNQQAFLHAQMYSLASMLNLNSLLEAARTAFYKELCSDSWLSETTWPDLIHYVYTSTAPGERHLRRNVLCCVKHATLHEVEKIDRARLEAAIETCPKFGVDLVMTFVGQELYGCRRCGEQTMLLFQKCGHGSGHAESCSHECGKNQLEEIACPNCGVKDTFEARSPFGTVRVLDQ